MFQALFCKSKDFNLLAYALSKHNEHTNKACFVVTANIFRQINQTHWLVGNLYSISRLELKVAKWAGCVMNHESSGYKNENSILQVETGVGFTITP